jgi:ribosomal protein L37AE/L43A
MKKTKKLYCRICEKRTKHDYAGKQIFKEITYDLWNCKKCGATRTE